MAYLVGGRCFATSADAADWVFSQTPVSLAADGSFSVLDSVSGSWVVSRYDPAGVLIGQHAAPVPAFAACDPGAAVADASLIAWLVVGVWASAWAINALRRALL